MTHQEFIDAIAGYVKKYAPQFGIKVCSPIIAQACLESGYGTSYKAQFHNYFGLKYRPNRVTCNNGYFKDGGSEQETDGSYTPIETDWYSFENMDMGVLGYFQFINTTNYASLKGVTDPYQYLVNIKACNYATSKDYVKNVWNVVQSNGLTKYDDIQTKSLFKVAVDAGHGSETPGKRTPDNYREHWINVATASHCEEALKRSGIDVLRVAWDDTNAKDDEDTPLSTRQKLIKANNCIVSVSFHANAAADPGWSSASGVETLISNKYPGDSKRLADIVQSYLVQGTPQKNRGVKTQSLAMCNCNALGVKAAILCEIGFMTNKAEADLMKTDKFCKEQGEQAAHGICDYLGIKFNETGSVISEVVQQAQSTPTGYLVRINTNTLNVRTGAGTSYPVVTTVHKGEVYTIVDEMNGWGFLKSRIGYIKLSYTEKI